MKNKTYLLFITLLLSVIFAFGIAFGSGVWRFGSIAGFKGHLTEKFDNWFDKDNEELPVNSSSVLPGSSTSSSADSYVWTNVESLSWQNDIGVTTVGDSPLASTYTSPEGGGKLWAMNFCMNDPNIKSYKFTLSNLSDYFRFYFDSVSDTNSQAYNYIEFNTIVNTISGGGDYFNKTFSTYNLSEYSDDGTYNIEFVHERLNEQRKVSLYINNKSVCSVTYPTDGTYVFGGYQFGFKWADGAQTTTLSNLEFKYVYPLETSSSSSSVSSVSSASSQSVTFAY